MMFDSFLFVVGTLLMTLAPNFYVIILGRLIHGHSSASAMVAVPIYTSEISQPQVRKLTGNFTLICYSCGFAFALILGKVLLKKKIVYFIENLMNIFIYRSAFSLEMGYWVSDYRTFYLPDYTIFLP